MEAQNIFSKQTQKSFLKTQQSVNMIEMYFDAGFVISFDHEITCILNNFYPSVNELPNLIREVHRNMYINLDCEKFCEVRV